MIQLADTMVEGEVCGGNGGGGGGGDGCGGGRKDEGPYWYSLSGAMVEGAVDKQGIHLFICYACVLLLA